MTQFDFFAAWIRAHATSDRAASLVEYALLVALIAVVCIIGVTTLGRRAASNFSSISNQI